MENDKNLKDDIVGAIKAELSGEFGSIRKQFDAMGERFDAVDQRFDAMDQKMDEGFRRQGVLIEVMQGDIDTLVDGQEILHGRIDRLQGSVSRIEAKVEDIDARLVSVEVA